MHGITACTASRRVRHHGVHGTTACMAGSTLNWQCDPAIAHADDVPQLFPHGVMGHEQAPATHLWLSHPSNCLGPCVWALEVYMCDVARVWPCAAQASWLGPCNTHSAWEQTPQVTASLLWANSGKDGEHPESPGKTSIHNTPSSWPNQTGSPHQACCALQHLENKRVGPQKAHAQPLLVVSYT